MRLLSLLLLLFFTLFSYTLSQSAYECTCVYYYLCRKGNRTVITDGEGIFDERLGDSCTDTDCSPDCPENYRCCKHENSSIKLREPEITTLPVTSRNGCGFRNPDGVGFKINAAAGTANFGEFPWMVGILDDSGSYRCGGSLIHPSVVLTAAHCVLRKKTYTVRAGEWDSSNTKEFLKHKDILVSSVKIHENYNPAVHYNDIALLFLDGSFDLSQHINTICLPQESALIGTDKCYVTGWGKDQFGSKGKYPAILKKIDLPLVEKNVCETNLRQTKLGRRFNLHSSAICAGGEKNKDACIGDGGGPLVCSVAGEDKIYQQIGIVSWGVQCNQENVPGVYTNVKFLKKWVDQQMKERNLDVSSYEY